MWCDVLCVAKGVLSTPRLILSERHVGSTCMLFIIPGPNLRGFAQACVTSKNRNVLVDLYWVLEELCQWLDSTRCGEVFASSRIVGWAVEEYMFYGLDRLSAGRCGELFWSGAGCLFR